jgi:hypothetical protein
MGLYFWMKQLSQHGRRKSHNNELHYRRFSYHIVMVVKKKRKNRNQTHLDIWHRTMGHGLHLEHRNYGTLSIESPASNNWCTMVCPKCRYSEWPTDPNHQRRNYSLQLQVQHWTKHASQPSSNWSLESTCLPETKETPAIRSALQIHSKHVDSNHNI